jgi:hypothetical protein
MYTKEKENQAPSTQIDLKKTCDGRDIDLVV